MSAPRMTRDEKKAQTRQRLLDAAAEVFARRGIAGASLDEIAAEAGLTKGAVYSNFANKEELVIAVLDERSHDRMRGTLEHIDFGGDPGVEARKAGDVFVRMDKEQSSLVPLWLEALTYATRNAEFAARLAEGHRVAMAEIAEIIERTSDKFGMTLSMPPHELAVLCNALINGLEIEQLHSPGSVPDDFLGRALALIYEAAGSD